MTEHTPTPWVKFTIEGEEGWLIQQQGDLQEEWAFDHHVRVYSEENAEFIVLAVNSHDALLAALEAVRDRLRLAYWAGLDDYMVGNTYLPDITESVAVIEAALTLAKKGAS